MKNIELDVYITSVFRLTDSLVIKIDELAKRDNKILEKAGYPVSSDKQKWRYYMNLNGDYHPTDNLMYVNSLDTGERIVFSKENLELHKATAREYRSQGYWYQRLVMEYEHQTALISGIMSPIPYDETINAKNYKILRYNKDLVQWNEDQFIPQLQKYVDSIVAQTFHDEYMNTEDLKLPVMIMNLASAIIQAIHTIRINAAGTRNAHNFYIWSHINSYGDFTKYKTSLDRYQTMWLYRNIAWIMNNAGQQYTFNLLMKNLLSHGKIPLAKYDLIENTKTQLKQLTPTPNYRKLQLNLFDYYGSEPTYIDTPDLINKQLLMARDNPDQKYQYQQDAILKGKYSLHSEIPTKALESTMRDYTNRHLDTMMSVLRNEWIYLSYHKRYNATALITDPKTGRQFRVNSIDAYHIWNWLCKKGQSISMEYVCPVNYYRVMRLQPPSVDDLIKMGGVDFIHPSLANNVRDVFVPADIMISPEALLDYAKEVYDARWDHKKLYSQFYDLNQRARTKLICDNMYVSGVAELGDYELYDEIFSKYELSKDTYSDAEAALFAWEVFKVFTGWDFFQHQSLRAKQSDLIELMLKLSSYTIHAIVNMDDGDDVTELPSETFVGIGTLLGFDSPDMEPSLKGTRIGERTKILPIGGLEQLIVLPTVNRINPDISVQTCIDLRPNEGYVHALERSVEDVTIPIVSRGHLVEVDVVYADYAHYDDELYLGLLPKDS